MYPSENDCNNACKAVWHHGLISASSTTMDAGIGAHFCLHPLLLGFKHPASILFPWLMRQNSKGSPDLALISMDRISHCL